MPLNIIKDEYGHVEKKRIDLANAKIAKFIDSYEDAELPSRTNRQPAVGHADSPKPTKVNKRMQIQASRIKQLEESTFKTMLINKKDFKEGPQDDNSCSTHHVESN